MPESPRHTAILLGIAALYEFADMARKGPLPPLFELRALLALLHAFSDGHRESYDAFWKHALDQGLVTHHENANGYLRSTTMRIEIIGIGRTLGIDLRAMELNQVISRIRAQRRGL